MLGNLIKVFQYDEKTDKITLVEKGEGSKE